MLCCLCSTVLAEPRGACNRHKGGDSATCKRLSAEFDSVVERYKAAYRTGNHRDMLNLAQHLVSLADHAFGKGTLKYGFALLGLGEAYEVKAAYREAEASFSEALAIYARQAAPHRPTIALINSRLALVARHQGKLSEAAAHHQAALSIREGLAGIRTPEIAENLDQLADVQQLQRQYDAAELTLNRVVELWAQENRRIELASSLRKLGEVYENQSKYEKAIATYEQLLTITRLFPGGENIKDADTLDKIAELHTNAHNYGAAIQAYERSLVIKTRANVSRLKLADTMMNLARVHVLQDSYSDAEELYKKALTIREDALGRDDPGVGAVLNNFGLLRNLQERFVEAESLITRGYEILERHHGPNSLPVAASLNNMALLYERQDRVAEAEGLYRRALSIREKVFGSSSPELISTLSDLANMQKRQGKYDQAEVHYKRALAINGLAPANNRGMSDRLSNLAQLYIDQERYVEAKDLLLHALAIRERLLGSDHKDVGDVLQWLGRAEEHQKSYTAAADFYLRALAIRKAALGDMHLDTAESMYRLAVVYRFMRLYSDAEPLYVRALDIRELLLGSHAYVAGGFANLALFYNNMGSVERAVEATRKATSITVKHASEKVGATSRQKQLDGSVEQLVRGWSSYFHQHLANLAMAWRKDIGDKQLHGLEAFETAQWAFHSSAAEAVAQQAARSALDDPGIAPLVRERQDLAAAWREREKALLDLISNSKGANDFDRIVALRRQNDESANRLREIATSIESAAPSYTALSSPKPLTLDAVQKLLGADEALLFFLTGNEIVYWEDLSNTYIFAVTRDGFAWTNGNIQGARLRELVAEFRQGLTVDGLIGSAASAAPVLFDLDLSHFLYKRLFGPVEALIRDKRHLLIAPSGPLTALPFHLLVTEEPTLPRPELKDIAAYRDAAWVLKRHAVTVLPSVASLKALRVAAGKRDAPKPLIAFGDPVFKDEAEPPGPHQVALNVRAKIRAYSDYWQGAALDRARLAEALPRLEGTADELHAVAARLGAPTSDIHLRKAASETTVKRAPLSDYRVVYFATHGLVAGDVKGLGEPALALTIPSEPSELDDGLLTASEVAQLKLNAEWVVLSACNTMAGDRPGAEALSGLARAFFYAGARALLVSHWAVDSDAATRLTTTTFEILKTEPNTGRSEALRRAMLEYMNDETHPHNAYPAFWGPFSIVGEGAVK